MTHIIFLSNKAPKLCLNSEWYSQYASNQNVKLGLSYCTYLWKMYSLCGEKLIFSPQGCAIFLPPNAINITCALERTKLPKLCLLKKTFSFGEKGGFCKSRKYSQREISEAANHIFSTEDCFLVKLYPWDRTAEDARRNFDLLLSSFWITVLQDGIRFTNCQPLFREDNIWYNNINILIFPYKIKLQVMARARPLFSFFNITNAIRLRWVYRNVPCCISWHLEWDQGRNAFTSKSW